jgi:uncharacterized Tic20 family protein
MTQVIANEIPVQVATADEKARQWAMFIHLSALAGGIVPFGHIVLPLVLWQAKKAESPFIDEAGKEAVNFNLSVTIYLFAALLAMFVLIGFVLVPAVGVAALVLAILAGIKASKGESYRYPYIIRFIK